MGEQAMDDAGNALFPPGMYPADAIAYGNLVLMAYAMSGQGLQPPKPSNFPKDYEIITNVIMNDYGTATFYGFLVRSKLPRTNNFVLVIRGTLSLSEWLIDLQSMFPTSFYNFGNVGSGFADTYKTIRLIPPFGPTVASGSADKSFAEQVAGAVEGHAAAADVSLPAPRLAVAGHSLGSALITLYAVERLVTRAIPLDAFCTFASPLVGDPTFAQSFNNLRIPVTYRIFNNWDPVPSLPPLSGFVPVGAPKSYKLSAAYYGFDPFCSHPLDTYMNCLDPVQYPPAYACTHLIPAAAEMVARTRMPPSGQGPAVIAHAPPTPAATQPPTTVTVTIQHGGGTSHT